METDFNLIETVRDAAKYGDKIDALIKAKKDAESARDELSKLKDTIAKYKAETDNYVNGRKAELQQKQNEHDAAATEAATRIELGRQQMAEVLRLREENDARDRALSAKELDLKAREKSLADEKAALVLMKGSIDKAQDLVRRQQAHMAALPKS